MRRSSGWCGLAFALAPMLGWAQVYPGPFSRTDTIEYADHSAAWVLGQVASSTNVDTGLVESRTVHDPATALPLQTFAFGKLQQVLAWNGDGTLASVSDGRDAPHFDTTVAFSQWKRGIPQRITFPDGTFKSASVDAVGQIQWAEDEVGYRTCYRFDALGRLAQVTYPSETLHACDESQWNALHRSFAPAATSEFGLPAGHWKETTRTGDGYRVAHYDGLWRPVVVERFDAADKPGTWTQAVTRYAPEGGVAFQSYPGSGIAHYATADTGTRTTYDALGRPTRVEQDSEHGVLVTRHDYIAGFLTLVTAPGGQVTRTAYQAYDTPSTELVRGITHPEGASTDIVRDVFGQPVHLSRRNLNWSTAATRSYTYNAHRELCRTTEPETGVTLMGYDAAGNLAWSASGLPVGTPCEADGTSATVAARKATRTWDNRNRVTALEFADDTGEQTWTYTPDGLPGSVWTYNGPGRTEPIYNAYSYNSRRQLGGVGEMQHQAGWYTWSLGYGYDRNGFLAAQAYPDTSSYTYQVNALGQTTRITGTSGTYVSDARYHPNGALRQFTYGNGLVHTLEQNDRGLPLRSRSAHGGVAVLDDSYDYDFNGNVAAISDALDGGRGHRTMTYDGLDRLTSVTSPMYGGTIRYGYDVLDNIETLVAPGRNLRYCYQSGTNRLAFIRSGATDCSNGAATATFGFDVQGNVRSKNAQGYTFSQDNRLRSVDGKERYRYDAHGRRVTSEHATLGFIRSFYDKAGRLAFQVDGRSGKNLAYIHLAGSLVATREQSTAGGVPVLKFHHTDALGTPVVVTDLGRKVIERNEYEPYGKLLNRPITDGPGYTGHVQDAQSGLTYMQQRYYDPEVGRFLSVDPASADKATGWNFNRYNYASNNPYAFNDPDGRVANFVFKAALDFGLELAIQYTTTGTVDLSAAAIETGKGILNPRKTVERARDVARILKADKAGDVRRAQGAADTTVDTERAARREAMRQHGAQVSLPNNFKRESVHGQNDNLRGARGEPSEVLTTTDARTGQAVTIDHHSNGHQFRDNGTYELPHYHGKRGSHISYEKE